MKPNFEHDCEKCQFLGSVVIEGEVQDLYYCAYEPTIISRYGTDGDYSSGLCFGESALVRHVNGDARGNKGLMVAYTLALANGLNVKEPHSVNELTLIEKIKTYRKGE